MIACVLLKVPTPLGTDWSIYSRYILECLLTNNLHTVDLLPVKINSVQLVSSKQCWAICWND